MLEQCKHSQGIDMEDECRAAVDAIFGQKATRRAESEMGVAKKWDENWGMFILSTKKTSMEKVTLTLFVFGF